MAQPDDSGMVRLDDSTTRGVAVSTDCNGRFAKLNPYAGAQLAFSEAFRNVAVTGATPIAVTNCLNFGSPEDPDVMWQFSQAVGGLADACLEMGTPVTGGNVSFYNQTGEVAILPTPVVGVLGVINDVASRVRSAFVADDDVVMLLGTTRVELNGSEWAHEIHGHLGGLPPVVDLKAERALASFMADAVAQGLLSAAHDVSDGGVAQTLVEMAMQGNRGVSVDLGSSTDDRFVALYSESVARAVVTMPPQQADAVIALATQHGVPVEPIGRVTGTSIDTQGGFTLPLDEVRAAHQATLPALFDHTND
jgi:phosphoribosylformylglycinamidine synthase